MKTEPMKALTCLFHDYFPGNRSLVGENGQEIFDPISRTVVCSDGSTPGGVVVTNPHKRVRISQYQLGHVVPLTVVRERVLSYMLLLLDDIQQLVNSKDETLNNLQAYISDNYKNLIRFFNEDIFYKTGKIHWEFLTACEQYGFNIWFDKETKTFHTRICGRSIAFKELH